jgi:ATP-binding cassette subfamily F protein uup
MDASTKARTTKSKSRQEDFLRDKKAQSRRKENKVELEINMGRMGSKIIELHKISKNSRPGHLDNFTIFNRENALESSGKMENQPFKLID